MVGASVELVNPVALLDVVLLVKALVPLEVVLLIKLEVVVVLDDETVPLQSTAGVVVFS